MRKFAPNPGKAWTPAQQELRSLPRGNTDPDDRPQAGPEPRPAVQSQASRMGSVSNRRTRRPTGEGRRRQSCDIQRGHGRPDGFEPPLDSPGRPRPDLRRIADPPVDRAAICRQADVSGQQRLVVE